MMTLLVSPRHARIGPPSAHSPRVALFPEGGQSVVLLNATWIEWLVSWPVQAHQYFGVTVSPMYELSAAKKSGPAELVSDETLAAPNAKDASPIAKDTCLEPFVHPSKRAPVALVEGPIEMLGRALLLNGSTFLGVLTARVRC